MAAKDEIISGILKYMDLSSLYGFTNEGNTLIVRGICAFRIHGIQLQPQISVTACTGYFEICLRVAFGMLTSEMVYTTGLIKRTFYCRTKRTSKFRICRQK